MPETNDQPLLDPQFLARLEQLELVSRKVFLGRMKGERRSKRKGQSVEFADYRNYVVGDDLRHRTMFGERPRLPYGDVAGRGGRLDLPPGAMSSSNIASAGKMYTFHVAE